MKLIKIFFCLLTLSSCNKYLGTLEPDYVPVNEVTDFLPSDINIKQTERDIVFNKIKYPQDNETRIILATLKPKGTVTTAPKYNK